ncbi:MAG TPA: DUF3015 family protein [Polyangia bacterium]|nr:DUF3015 family protein [Polyangia bacterium]
MIAFPIAFGATGSSLSQAMKKRAAIVIGLLASALSGGAQAQWRGRPPPPPPGYGGGWYGMAGCGLGSVIFGPLNTPGAQVMAASTNATGVQTFAITSGTSNCISGGVVAMDRRQEVFAEVNFRDLKRDMAAGGGEYLSAFEDLLGCDGAVHPDVARLMQAEYETLLPSESTTPDQLVGAVHARISADPDLGPRCRNAG